MQSYWNGSAWTGESRPTRSLSLSFKPKSAFSWVLLAIVLGVVGGVVSDGRTSSVAGWVFSVASTGAWVAAALTARRGIGRLILWLIVIGNAVFWLISLGLMLSSTGLAMNLGVGTCFDEPGTARIAALDTVPCDQPHYGEVFDVASVALLGDEYPDATDLSEFAGLRCMNAFRNYVGGTPAESGLAVNWLVPSPEAWASGERNIMCVLYRMDGQQLERSAKDTGF